MKKKILHCRNKWKTKNTTPSEQNEKQKYYTVGIKWKAKNTTFSEQKEKQTILHCQN
jgi:hypothetical protein